MVCDGPEPTAVLAARDLAGALSEGQAGPTLDLLETPGDPRPCAPIHPKATLPEAAERLAAGTAEALFVVRPTRSGASRILGVLTREDIDAAYRP